MDPIEVAFGKTIDFFSFILYGYGVKPLYPAAWSTFFIVLFGIFWRTAGVTAPLRFSARAFFSGTKLFIDPPKIPKYLRVPRWLNYFVNRFGPPLLQDILTVERVLGALFSLLLFLAIGRTIIRWSSLIRQPWRFVDPFFKALRWDLDNAQGFAEAYKEIIHEDTIKVGHSQIKDIMPSRLLPWSNWPGWGELK